MKMRFKLFNFVMTLRNAQVRITQERELLCACGDGVCGLSHTHMRR